jgi:hypothetical protein
MNTNCLGGLISQTLANEPRKLFYGIKDEMNFLSKQLKDRGLSVLNEPIEVIFDEFFLSNSTMQYDPGCMPVEYELSLYYYYN